MSEGKKPKPSATTEGIHVSVETWFVPERSRLHGGPYFFAYRITIRNKGDGSAQLRSRHWVITDASGRIEEVKGDGVVGEQPKLEPQQSHRYTSFCILRAPRGTMHGTYRMQREDGSFFDAAIPTFALVAPVEEAKQLLN